MNDVGFVRVCGRGKVDGFPQDVEKCGLMNVMENVVESVRVCGIVFGLFGFGVKNWGGVKPNGRFYDVLDVFIWFVIFWRVRMGKVVFVRCVIVKRI